MSRTYILRHVPALPGTSRKIAVGVGPEREQKARNEIFKEVARILGTSVREYCHFHFGYRRGWSNFLHSQITKEEWDLFYHIEDETIFPIKGPYRHPWRHGFPNNLAKTWYKQRANRKARHKEKEMLNKLQIEWDEILLPRKSEYFDSWSFD